jgi:hypothetical protein
MQRVITMGRLSGAGGGGSTPARYRKGRMGQAGPPSSMTPSSQGPLQPDPQSAPASTPGSYQVAGGNPLSTGGSGAAGAPSTPTPGAGALPFSIGTPVASPNTTLYIAAGALVLGFLLVRYRHQLRF